MKKRLQFYLNYYETLTTKKIPDHRRGRQGTKAIAHSNSIFQHERLIHLIVTALFALLTILSLFASLLLPKQPVLLALDILFLVLLIPYIFHYYRLENGVQKLYEYYDKLSCR